MDGLFQNVSKPAERVGQEAGLVPKLGPSRDQRSQVQCLQGLEWPLSSLARPRNEEATCPFRGSLLIGGEMFVDTS